ncbi:dihydrolipoyl dehydrogenase [Trichloromonas sp.]|uniref:dihydrolipoyl dehydrogenase n=1 Tax=Trichloromonas sp. TaxID=3069249 RepID=UPI002A3C3C4B|nr:dihydrolipoyl dehydrogenase [Trichloromonas sp.]
MEQNVDVIIVGAGSAGLAALREVRKRTDNFLLINDGPYGTTCARVGCMPSKALIEAANAFARRNDFPAFGISGGESLAVDIPAVLRRVRNLRDKFVGGVLKATEDLGERNLPGRARLLDGQTVEVDGRRFRAKRIVLAPGSRPVVPEAWCALGDGILTTDNLFDQTDLPGRMAVIGLGAIGVEMAQALARLGITINAFDLSPRLAGLSDEEVNENLVKLLGREFAIHTGVGAELRRVEGGIEVAAGTAQVVVDRVLVAMGRRPNIDGLGLESLGIPLDKRGQPQVNPSTLQVADLPIFLAGDANGQAALLHEAADEGHIAGINAVAESIHCFKRRTPLAVVFSDPEVAAVGKRLAELDPETVIFGKVSFARHGRARTAEKNKGVLHIYADKKSGRLLGAEMCVPAAEHMAHLLALAIERGLKVMDLLRMPFYHPVYEEGLRSALRELAGQLPGAGESDLASCGAYAVEALD